MMSVKIGKRIGIGLLALIAAAGAVGGMALNARAEPEEEIIWREYEVKYDTITASLDSGGVLKGEVRSYRAPVDTEIAELKVHTGQEVHPGDILVVFDEEKLAHQLRKKKEELSAARRSLEDARNSKSRFGLEKEASRLEKEEAALTQYEGQRREKEKAIAAQVISKEQTLYRLDSLCEELKRLEKGQQGTVSGNEDQTVSLKNQIRQVEAELAVADNTIAALNEELEALEKDYRKTKEGGGAQDSLQKQLDELSEEGLYNAVENAGAQVKLLEEEVKELEQLLKTPWLEAQTEGVVTGIAVEEGMKAAAGQVILTSASQEEGRLVITQIPQEDIANVEEGQETEVQFLACPDRVFHGVVTRKGLVPVEGTDTVVYEVGIFLEDTDETLLEGMTCGIKFIRKRVENVLTLSNKAISLKDGSQVVNVLQPDGSHEERVITTGFSDGRISEIVSGLEEGDIVVVAG